MSDCTCVRGDDGQVRVPRSRCPQHGWAGTPAPALTDYEIDQDALMAVPAGTVVRADDGTIAARYDETRGVVFGDERPFPWSVLHAPAVVLWPVDRAAVEARAKREERDEITRMCDTYRASLYADERNREATKPTRDALAWVTAKLRHKEATDDPH